VPPFEQLGFGIHIASRDCVLSTCIARRHAADMLRIFTALVVLTLSAIAERPEKWAQPVPGTSVKNLNRVTPQLYRSAQPDAAGMRALEKLGIRTVINLRDLNDDKKEARGTKLRLHRVKMDAWQIEDEDVVRALAMLRRKGDGPFLVHCHHGSDRTGVVCAMFRLVEQRWSREDAIRELKDGGFGFHKTWVNIPRYLAKVDIEKIRREVDALAK
jgi:protein tyrosine/serine phosphatase